MSEFNSYATQLNKAFLEAKQKMDQALAEYKEAEKPVMEDSQLTEREKYQGDRKFRIAEHEAKYQIARQNMNKVLGEVWLAFYRTRDSLTTALQEAVGKEEAVNADDVDINGVILLNSPIINSYDLEALQKKYEGNATMTRLVGRKAKEIADTTKENDERRACIIIMNNCKVLSKSDTVLTQWELLCRASDIYSNESDQTDPAYVSMISDHWNDDNIQNAIKNF